MIRFLPFPAVNVVHYLGVEWRGSKNEQWVSVDDIAKHLGVVKDSVYRWIENKELPAHKIGRLWKSKLSEVDDWVRSGGAADSESKTSRKKEEKNA